MAVLLIPVAQLDVITVRYYIMPLNYCFRSCHQRVMSWSCRQPSIGLEGSSRTIAACSHRTLEKRVSIPPYYDESSIDPPKKKSRIANKKKRTKRGAVNWMSKLQPIVTVSSIEAEYLACFFAIQDVVWIRQLLRDIDLERSRPTRVFIDNQSARQLAMNPVHHQRSKHIDIKYHWIRDKVAAQEIELIHVPKTEGADFLSKTLPADVFWRHAVAIVHALYLGSWF